jgi:hypothetical protein
MHHIAIMAHSQDRNGACMGPESPRCIVNRAAEFREAFRRGVVVLMQAAKASGGKLKLAQAEAFLKRFAAQFAPEQYKQMVRNTVIDEDSSTARRADECLNYYQLCRKAVFDFKAPATNEKVNELVSLGPSARNWGLACVELIAGSDAVMFVGKANFSGLHAFPSCDLLSPPDNDDNRQPAFGEGCCSEVCGTIGVRSFGPPESSQKRLLFITLLAATKGCRMLNPQGPNV